MIRMQFRFRLFLIVCAILTVAIGVTVAISRLGVLAQASVTFAGRTVEFQLRDQSGVVCATAWEQGDASVMTKTIAAIDVEEARRAEFMFDDDRQEARFVLDAGDVVFVPGSNSWNIAFCQKHL